MNREDALLHWVWLAEALGPGGVHVRDVLDAFGTPQALYEACLLYTSAPGHADAGG